MPYIQKDWDSALGITETLQRDIALEKSELLVTDDLVEEAQFETAQVRELAAADLDFLAGIAMPTVFKFCFPPVLLAAWDLVTQSVNSLEAFIQLALGIPRGHGKTTFIKLFILYCVLFTKRKFILIISDTASKAENILADITDMLNELNIIRVFGDWRMGIETDRQDMKKFGYRGRPIILVAMGAGGSLRGLNIKNERPDVMVFDDIQTKECSESKPMSESLERWMIGTAMKAKSPSGCLFIFAGNMYPGENSILKKLKGNANWIKFISGALLADGTALWPELRSVDSLVKEFDNDISMGHPEIFLSEVLNDTEAGVNTNTDLTLLRDWKWGDLDRPQGKFIFIDPSGAKVNSDATAIGYFEIYDGQIAMREVIEEQLSPGNAIRKTILLCLKTGTRLIVVESVGYQATFLYWFEQIAKQLNLQGLYFVEMHSGSQSKNARISTMLRELTAGDIILHPDIKYQVTKQISNWNPMKRDNEDGILDVLTYAPRVLKTYGGLAISLEHEIIEGNTTGAVQEFNSPF